MGFVELLEQGRPEEAAALRVGVDLSHGVVAPLERAAIVESLDSAADRLAFTKARLFGRVVLRDPKGLGPVSLLIGRQGGFHS